MKRLQLEWFVLLLSRDVCVDRLILSRSHRLVYCLLDQLNNGQGSSHCCALPCSLYSPSTPLNQHFSASWPLSSSPSPCVPISLCPLQSLPISFAVRDNSGAAACPACCCRPIILWCCLPSGHLAPTPQQKGFWADSCPWQSKKQTEGQSAWRDGKEKQGGEVPLAWPHQSVLVLQDSRTPSNLLTCGGQTLYHGHKDQIPGLEYELHLSDLARRALYYHSLINAIKKTSWFYWPRSLFINKH